MALDADAEDFLALLQAGASARRVGDPAAAVGYLERAAELRPDAWLPSYNLACLAASTGETAAALEHLGQAVERGMVAPRLLQGDPDLHSLRGTPELDRLIEEMGDRSED